MSTGVDRPGAAAVESETLPDGYLRLAPDGTVVATNATAARLLGVRAAALTGAALPALVDDAGRDWWACDRRRRALRSVTRLPEQRLRVGGLDGPPVHLTARYLRGPAGLEGIVLLLREGGARDRIERTHADLISTVAHELRAPLTSVKGFTATMLAKWDRFSDEQKRQMLEWINGDADRVTRLIAELLDVSRIDAGRLELHRQVVDLPAVVEHAVAGRVAGGEPPERFCVAVAGRLPEIWADPDKVEQIVANLIENALRHGGGTVTVTVTGRPDGAEVDVDDEGPGVPDAIASRVFSKFFRGAPRRGGTGLGLYIVRGLVEAHGGSVTVGRAPGGGARFRFRLPAGTPTYAS